MREGRELREKGDHAGALKKYRAAFALVPSPVTGLAVAREHVALGQLVEAREMLSEISRMPVKATETEDGTKAREEAAVLLTEVVARLPVIEIKLTGVPAGKSPRLAVDGQPVPVVAAAEGLRLNPGNHTILGQVEGAADVTKSVAVEERERSKVELTFVPLTSGSPTAPALDRTSASSTKTVGMLIVGAGVVVMGAGGVLGLSARSKYNDVKAAHCNDSGICDADGKQGTDDARALGNIGTLTFGIGAVVTVGGAVLWLTAPGPEKKTGITSLSVGAGSLSVAGRF